MRCIQPRKPSAHQGHLFLAAPPCTARGAADPECAESNLMRTGGCSVVFAPAIKERRRRAAAPVRPSTCAATAASARRSTAQMVERPPLDVTTSREHGFARGELDQDPRARLESPKCTHPLSCKHTLFSNINLLCNFFYKDALIYK
jgi:hypothetical protein